MTDDRAKKRMATKHEISAGGIVYKNQDGAISVLMILPARRNDPLMSSGFTPTWTFPKGWVGDHGDEAIEQTAIREVREEGGVEAKVVAPLGSARYFFNWQGQNVSKTVHWFLMEYVSGNPADHDHEVDKAEWVPIAEAEKRVTYPTDKQTFAKAKKALNDR
jgi:8-oxo-dGTP pyrophosphatase MutT (NUDIX family)